MDDVEIRLRCIEAASRSPSASAHTQGYGGGVLEVAQQWALWIKGHNKPYQNGGGSTLGLPKKKS